MEGKTSIPDMFHGVQEMAMSEDYGDASLPSLKTQALLRLNLNPTNHKWIPLNLSPSEIKIEFLQSFSYPRETVELKIFKTGLDKTLNNVLTLTLFEAAVWTRWPLETPFKLNFPVNLSLSAGESPQTVSIFPETQCTCSDIKLQLGFEQKLLWMLYSPVHAPQYYLHIRVLPHVQPMMDASQPLHSFLHNSYWVFPHPVGL